MSNIWIDGRVRSRRARPGGLLSALDEQDFDVGEAEVLDRDPTRAWAEGLAKSRLYGDLDVDELAAMAKAREKEYATNELLDRELGISEPEAGGEIVAAATEYLRLRGIDAKTADYETMAAAMSAVSA